MVTIPTAEEDTVGYCISLSEVEFRIKSVNKLPALRALKELARATQAAGATLAWVDLDEVLDADSIGEAMRAFSYEVDVERETEDVVGLEFEGEKLGDEKKMLDAIAPHVEPGSYLQVQGEDGEMWRWVFDGVTCAERRPTVTW